MIKKAFFAFATLLIFTSIVLAEARPMGMGGAFVALADDSNAVFRNPAGIGYLKEDMAEVSTRFQHDGGEDTKLGAVEKTSFGNIGIGYSSMSGALEKLTGPSVVYTQGDTPVKSLDQMLVVSYARELNRFMVGSNLKLGSSRVLHANGLAYGGGGVDMDLAAIFKPGNGLSCALAYKSIFGKGFGSATGLSAGVAGRLGEKITWSLENDKAGCEWKPVPALAFRVGRDGAYNAAGVGLARDGFSIDYAYTASEFPAHYISVSLLTNGRGFSGYKQHIAQL
ncbi:MAG: hypothetical protein WCT39_02020 [Candidatus Margulisiibacteriota bacterium]